MVRDIASFDDAAAEDRSAPQARGRACRSRSVTLETPIPWPHKLLALPSNFRAHHAEMRGRAYASPGSATADDAGFFMKSNVVADRRERTDRRPRTDRTASSTTSARWRSSSASAGGTSRVEQRARPHLRLRVPDRRDDARQGRARDAQVVRHVLPGRSVDHDRRRSRQTRRSRDAAVGQRPAAPAGADDRHDRRDPRSDRDDARR